MILIFVGQNLLRLFVILCSGSTPCSRSRQRTSWNNKQGGRKKEQEEIRKRMEEVDRKAAAEREANRKRKCERGHAVRRKPGPKQLERANILGALSRLVPCNPGILHFLRHGRFICNKKLSCRVHMPLQLVIYVFS